MASLSPAPAMDEALEEEIMARFIRPLAVLLARRGTPYRGLLYAGLMRTEAGLQLLEYNVRFGDPETQAMTAALQGGLLAALRAAAEGRLEPSLRPRFSSDHAFHLVAAPRDIPGRMRRAGASAAWRRWRGQEAPGILEVVHCATRPENGPKGWRAAGGRVLGLTGLGADAEAARRRVAAAAALLDWPGGFWRADLLEEGAAAAAGRAGLAPILAPEDGTARRNAGRRR